MFHTINPLGLDGIRHPLFHVVPTATTAESESRLQMISLKNCGIDNPAIASKLQRRLLESCQQASRRWWLLIYHVSTHYGAAILLFKDAKWGRPTCACAFCVIDSPMLKTVLMYRVMTRRGGTRCTVHSHRHRHSHRHSATLHDGFCKLCRNKCHIGSDGATEILSTSINNLLIEPQDFGSYRE